MTGSGKNGVILSFNMKQKANLVPEEFHSIFYAIYNYYIFSNIDNLLIGKLMTYIFNIFRVFIMQVFLQFFANNCVKFF